MKNLLIPVIFLLAILIHMQEVRAKQVSQADAQLVAVTFYRLNNPSAISSPTVRSVSVCSKDAIPAFYIFRFVSGGFVLVAADDAVIPVLGYSFDSEMPETIDHPAVAAWLDNYSRQIRYIVTSRLDNTETLKKWNSIRNGRPLAPDREVLPLLTTVWDLGCYYNGQCPADPGGPCGHAKTGCVATAMAQIMKYHNYPPQGVGQHMYTDLNYGPQSADFGNTFYDWAAMPDSLAGDNTAVATLMYHAGVAVDMHYGAGGSGSMGSYIPGALQNYFNYSPDMEIIYLDDFPDQELFKSLLRTDLDANLPICYGGLDTVPFREGHEFICDGYRMSDSTFHFNWGVGGMYNGYFALGHLNVDIYNWAFNNEAIIHIKPYNPDLIVRITEPSVRTTVNPGNTVVIKAKLVRGTSNLLKIFIDDFEKASASGDSLSYAWNIGNDDLGTHIVKAYACNSTDTVWYKQFLNVSDWITQSGGFQSGPVTLFSMSAVDSNIVWASTQNGPQFTRTVNGGASWTPGLIPNTEGLGSSMIFGLSSLKAYVAMYKGWGNKPQGIYITADGGSTWVRQASAYNNPASWPDVVHFYNTSEGFAIGDPINNEFELYTTINGGNTWIPVPGTNIPDPLPGEFGICEYYSVVQDTIWFGTNMGRVFRSVNRGHNWTVSTVAALSGKSVKPVFRNGSHGLLLDALWGSGRLFESFDGGITWNQVNYSGSNHHGDIDYLPGTPNTWVRSDFYSGGAGGSYSFDGGHTWTDFPGTDDILFYPTTWVDSHCGWAAGIQNSSLEGGIYKYTGWVVPKPAPENVLVNVNANNVDISWAQPNYDPSQITLQGYNIQRNGTRINPGLITGLNYTDPDVLTGEYTYCVSAQYNVGASEGTCNADVIVGIATCQEPSESLQIYPNPSSGKITIETEINGQLSFLNLSGQELMKQTIRGHITTIDISALPGGLYLVKMVGGKGVQVRKIVKE
jgi:photosystem II stability/assembly factor-like uncharacterized protein